MTEEQLRSARTLTAVVYGLQLATFALGFSAIIALIINYVKRDDVRGTWLDSHFGWQIRTFWYGLALALLGAAAALVWVLFFFAGVAGEEGLLAAPLLFAAFWLPLTVWYVYRIVKGFLRLNEGRSMESAAWI